MKESWEGRLLPRWVRRFSQVFLAFRIELKCYKRKEDFEMKSLAIHENGQAIYEIVFSNDFTDLKACLPSLHTQERKICIVSETRVASIYLDEVKDLFQEQSAEVIDFIFPEGEQSKNLQVVQNLYEQLILSHFDRKDLLVALGGGVVGDLTGYAAATYLRGIDFIQIPTSLLAQVDSSIGGKTGVDFNAYKNMVGAFHQPKLVYMNFSALKTLSKRQFQSGLGEIIKHGLIKDDAYYAWIKEHHDAIQKRDTTVLSELVYHSCLIKGKVVEEDPKEKGERALLNFGHTIGHAVEKLEDFTLLHGECVSLGIVAASFISRNRGLITDAAYQDICQTLKDFELPVNLSDAQFLQQKQIRLEQSVKEGTQEGQASPKQSLKVEKKFRILTAEEIVRTTKSDKKMEAGKIKFIVLSPVGHAVIDRTITDRELEEAAKEIGAI